MKTRISRREFLKIAGLLPLGFAMPPLLDSAISDQNSKKQNVLIVVFDAWSACNMSLYGYGRATTPNIDKLAEKAIVYHNHFAGSYFTTPGVGSLLTGTTPWTHRAFDYNDIVYGDLFDKSIFNTFQGYHRRAYTHNMLANTILRQFKSDIEVFTPWQSLYLESDPLVNTLFQKDYDTASISWNRALKRLDEGYAYTLYLSQLYENYKKGSVDTLVQDYPRGIPNFDGLSFFTLDQGIDWLVDQLKAVPQPFLGYYHFLPPHDPYFTKHQFFNAFLEDGFQVVEKPHHILRSGKHSNQQIIEQRRWYDEFILQVDHEFARLYNDLERNGVLENTWLILTSDHGDMFERGILAHNEPVYHRPVINIPLLIFPPDQENRVDIYDRTSAIDVLPTLSHITGQSSPSWAEGLVMPPFSKDSHAMDDRDISSVQVEVVNRDSVISVATAMLMRGDYKLTWFFGYEGIKEGNEYLELYDIVNDSEELTNLYPERKDIAEDMLRTLKTKMKALNEVYMRG